VLVGWYSSDVSPDHNNLNGQWFFHVAASFDAGKTFDSFTVTPTSYHNGPVCNLGTLCTSGRDLLDFTTVAVNPQTGCGFAVFAGDPYNGADTQNRASSAGYSTLQDGGPCLSAANAGRKSSIVPTVGPASHPAVRHARKKCVDRRKFTFRLHHARHARVVRVDVYVNGKRRVHRRGHDVKRVTLRRLPRKKFTVNVVARQSTGRTLISTRVYRGCKKSRPRTHRG
jgi:hypothetical protein